MSGDGYEVCVECGRERGSDSEPQVHRYKTDPRLGVADGYAHALATLLMDEREFLRLLDTADRAAGIVRVDTRDETRDRVVAACRHADWCCTKGCAQPNGVHYVGNWNEVPLDGDMTGLNKFAPCPGACTCEVAMIVSQVLDALAGDDQ